MPAVKFVRKIKGTINFEKYTIRDSKKKKHALTFRNGEAVLTLPKGKADLKVELEGNSESRVYIKISSPANNDQRRYIKIPRGEASVVDFRKFDV